MKKVLSLASAGFIFAAGLSGCTSTSNNANLRNANTNTGYLAPSANNSAAPVNAPMQPAPMGTAANANMNANGRPMTNGAMNSKMNSNTKANTNARP